MINSIVQKIKDEIELEKQFAEDESIVKTDRDLRLMFIGGLERAQELVEEELISSDPPWEESVHMNGVSEELIRELMEVIELKCPEYYSSSDLILKCEKWMKWANEESNPADLKEFFNYPN